MNLAMLKMKPNALLYAAVLLALLLPVLCRRRVEIIEEPDEEESDFDCPEQFGYYPDPGNCSRYHLCDHGKASVKSCDSGLYFSTILKTCDWPYNVHCADGEFTGRHLRLRGNNEEGKNENVVDQADQLPTNRRQPVLSNDDDSYWLGRPESTLLSLGDDDDFVDNYHYEEPQRLSKPRPAPQRQEPRRKEVRDEAHSEEEDAEERGQWFHNLNFDQIRRQEERKPAVFGRIENSTSTTGPATSPAPTSVASTNGRGSGWRQNQRTRTQQPTRTTELPQQLLPRKALRVGAADEDDIETANRLENVGQDVSDVRRQKEPQDSYRLVSRGSGPTTLPPSVPEALRPRHLGTSRRRNNRRQSTAAPTTTLAPETTPRPTARPWNARSQPTRQTARPEVNHRIPENAFRQFERRPVLRDSEDAPPRENFEDFSDSDDVLDDPSYYANPVEIRKKGSGRSDEATLTVPVPKDVSNSLDSRRPKQNSRPAPTNPPRSNKVDPQSIYRNFQSGFNGAVKPVPASNLRGATDDDGNTFRVNSNPSLDMEYEDVGNEDEDENVEEADNTEGVAHEDINSNNRPNKEIVVRYDDEEEESRKPGSRANSRPGGFITTLPPPTTPARPTPPRLTQFVDIFVHNQNKPNFSPASNRPNTAIQLVDLVSKQQKVVNPVPRSFVHFGIVPGLAPNNSLVFFPPPPPPLLTTNSPKQPRHTSTLDNFDKTPKKMQKVKVKDLKKQSKPKNELSKQKKFKQGPPLPKSFLNEGASYPRAKRCHPEVCQPPNCRCGGVDIPGGFAPDEIPQIVLLTFDDSVNDLNREIYKKLFEQGRTNPNGCPIRSTFYVSHEWTDYSQVQNLYAKGHEMASHSISHSFGEKFSKERWMAEIAGQREIMSLYGGVDWRDIRGMRAPFLQTGGNTMFEMLKEANFSYDSSMPVYDIDPPYWPYTLDYAVNHDCMIEPCPTKSIPGLWEVGMVMWEDLRGGRCSMADGCFNPSDEKGVYDMVKANFLRHYKSNKSPFGMYFHSRWFLTDHNMKGFVKFLDEMLTLKDVWVVTNWQMIQWMRRPTPLSQLRNFAPFGCDDIRDRPPLCKAPHTCKVRFRSETRTLRTCQSCPRQYPWTGNNGMEDDEPRH